ncbi:hypothetical protein I4200191B4_15570 [Pseudoflavonifractor gallinarum]
MLMNRSAKMAFACEYKLSFTILKSLSPVAREYPKGTATDCRSLNLKGSHDNEKRIDQRDTKANAASPK